MKRFITASVTLVLGCSASLQPVPSDSDDVVQQNHKIMDRMRALEEHLAGKSAEPVDTGHLLVNGPLPADFADKFSQAVSRVTGTDAKKVRLTGSGNVKDAPGVVEVSFQASPTVVREVRDEAADPNSALATGSLHSFLVADDDEESKDAKEAKEEAKEDKEAKEVKEAAKEANAAEAAPAPAAAAGPPTPASKPSREATPIAETGIDIDTQMPYGDLEPFGREDTAQELTESSVRESDEMVDQLERAEVAEEKRSVFRALTRLRGAAITSFDGVARAQTGNIDEYNKVNKWRKSHPMHHLADEESDISKWAFPDNADLLQKSHHA